MDALVNQMRSSGAAMVLVTHSTAAAHRADRILRLTATGLEPFDDAPANVAQAAHATPT
jgi:putative ABC transport system ATP-binding protein